METTPFPMTTSVSSLAVVNAFSPMNFTLSGIRTAVSAAPLKALSPMLWIFSPMEISESERQYAKQYAGMKETPAGILTFFSSRHP